MKSGFPVENVGGEVVCLFIEPLGEDFHLQPGDRFRVHGGEQDPEFSINVMPGYLILVVNGGSVYDIRVVDDRTGETLRAGHGNGSVVR